jgi:hypothetical protein
MTNTVNCACLIHGDVYSWEYVDNLLAMLSLNSTRPIQLHVFTESSRSVPDHMIKHALQEWPGIAGAKKSWWYKMQMFNPAHNIGQMLYLDLDTVITGNIDWTWDLSPDYFWAIRDFKYLWRPNWHGLNSSFMYWNADKFSCIWKQFQEQNIHALIKQYHGDQDYLNTVLDNTTLRFISDELVKSWRWQVKDGGMDMKTRIYRRPGAGAVLDPQAKILIFHGRPKPHEISDTVIQRLWNVSAVTHK